MLPAGSVRFDPHYVCAGDTLAQLAGEYAEQIQADPQSTLRMFQAANPRLAERAFALEPGTYVQLPRLLAHARLVQGALGLVAIAEQELLRHYGLPRPQLEQAMAALTRHSYSRLLARATWQLAGHNRIPDPRQAHDGEVVILPELAFPALRRPGPPRPGPERSLPSVLVDPSVAETSVSEPVVVGQLLPEPTQELAVVMGEPVPDGEVEISVESPVDAEVSPDQILGPADDLPSASVSISEMIAEVFQRDEDVPTSPYFAVVSREDAASARRRR